MNWRSIQSKVNSVQRWRRPTVKMQFSPPVKTFGFGSFYVCVCVRVCLCVFVCVLAVESVNKLWVLVKNMEL